VLAADALPTTRSVQRATDRSAEPPGSALGVDAMRARRDGSLTNYRIVLEVEQKGQPRQRFCLVMAEGNAELNTVAPTRSRSTATLFPP
jgi:hypothetical protein